MRNTTLQATVVFCLTLIVCNTANAETNIPQQALDEIIKTADGICGVVKTEGSSEGTKVSGEINSQLDGLFKKLVGLGFAGRGDYNADRYAGFLRRDLPEALVNIQKCKLEVFKTLATIMLVVDHTKQPIPTNEKLIWPIDTGQPFIDEVHSELNALPDDFSEGTLAAKLSQLFYRPVFDNYSEASDDADALYTFCRSQLLLDRYVGKFASPAVRHSISQATQNLRYLQKQLGEQLYGATFNRGDLCDHHSQTLDTYKQNLPQLTRSLRPADENTLSRLLTILRNNLSTAGIR